MRQIVVFAFTLFFAVGCNNQPGQTDATLKDTTASAETGDNTTYAYTLDQPYKDWQPGDKMHTVMVLKSLKAYETGDMDACISAFADSVELRFDGYRARLGKDSLKKMFTQSRGELTGLNIKMGDWQSVISKDKKDEYVTLWYKEIQTDKKGKTDSLSIVDDLKIVNGKIVELDQKIQHYPASGKK